MKKHQIQECAVLIILCIVFCLIAFLPPFAMTLTFWSAFVAGIVALAAQIYFFRYSSSSEGDAKSRFYGIPIIRIGIVYFIVQWILSILEMVFAGILPGWIAVLVDVLVLAAALLGGIAADTMRDEVIRQDTVLKKNVSGMRELQSLANTIVSQCDDNSIKEKLRKVSEQIQYSDPVSSEATVALEAEMLDQLKGIQGLVISGDYDKVDELSGKLLVNLNERNRICKLNK